MEQMTEDEIDWYAPESRELPLLDGGYRQIQGTRLLWHTYEQVMHYGNWSYRDILQMVEDELPNWNGDFDEAFLAVMSYRDTDVRLWIDAFIEQQRDHLDAYSHRLRQDWTAAIRP